MRWSLFDSMQHLDAMELCEQNREYFRARLSCSFEKYMRSNDEWRKRSIDGIECNILTDRFRRRL